jgi:hypothetical protein
LEKVFTITRDFTRHTKIADLRNINRAIFEELSAGRPVYASIPKGVFAGSIARLKLNQTIKSLSRIFQEATNYGLDLSDITWDLEIDGCNRSFHISWKSLFSSFYSKEKVYIYLGRSNGTVFVKNAKIELNDTLVDFMGTEIKDGDYVLMYCNSWELKDTGVPFRMLQYTGKRTPKQAMFKYVQLKEGTHNPDGGEKIRVGLNTLAGQDQVYGVKIEVETSLATAMQMTDHDMSIYPIKFSVGF